MLGRSKLQQSHRLGVNANLGKLPIELAPGRREAAAAEKRIAEPEAWAADAVRTVWSRAARAGAVEMLLIARGLL